MKKILIAVPILLVVLVAGLFIAPSLIPSSVYKETIEKQLSEKLERDVRVLGDIKLRAFPLIKANTGTVEISNPEGFTANNLASMSGLSARVKLFPLLSKRVEIASFTLKDPNINLEKLADGSANWIMGDASDKQEPSPPPTDQGPFKRDGRYTDIDPAIGKFILENGTISYSDKSNGTAHLISGMNIDFTLTSLSDPLQVDGNLVYNDTPASISVTLDSIRDFLSGKSAPISLSLDTEFAQIKAQGEFLPGTEIAASITLNGNVSDLEQLVDLAPVDIDIGTAISTVNLTGQYRFEDGILSAKDADISLSGTALQASFRGDALLKETPSLNGRIDVQSPDTQALLRALPKDIIPANIKGLELMRSLQASASLATKGEGFIASDIDANLIGDGFTAGFKGAADISQEITTEGSFSASVASVSALVTALGIDVPQADALSAITVAGDLSYGGELVSVTNLIATAKDGAVNGSYNGNFDLNGSIPSAQGNFEIALPSVPNALSLAKVDIPQASVLNSVNASGTLLMVGKNVEVKTISAKLKDGQVNGSYEGDVTIDDGYLLSGVLSLDVPSVRAAAKTMDTDLPASTADGEIFGPFSISGQVSGSPDALQFADAKIVFDALSGSGSLDVDLTTNTPLATARLDMNGLDLRPYMPPKPKQKTKQDIPPWSTDPLDLSFLKSLDADFDITSPTIITHSVTLGESNANASLRSGVLTADIPNVSLYGGLGRINAVVNGASDIPKVSLEAGLDDLNSNEFLTSIASFTKTTGQGGTTLKIAGEGNSQAEIMKSLSGGGDFSLTDGQISGVDLSQFLTGIEQAIQSRALPGGIGESYATEFSDVVGLFTIENGIIEVDEFSLSGFGVMAEGSGKVDLGGQNIDFRLRPRLTGEDASDLASSGIPLKFAGGFGKASAGLDTELIGQIVKLRAKQEAENLILEQVNERLGDTASGVLDTILGDKTSTNGGGPNEEQESPSGTEIVTDVLGGIFGDTSKDQDKESENEDDEKKNDEPNLEDTLGSIFGLGK